jgi:predicted component of type VI protein secretion system
MCRIETSQRWHLALFILLSLLAGCGGGSMSSSTSPSSLTLSLASNAAQVFQGQTTSVTVNATLLRS